MVALALALLAQDAGAFAKALDARLTAVYKPDEPGVAVLVARTNGEVLFKKGYGLADLEKRTPFTTVTVSNTGSISKTFVAYGVLKLVEQGKLKLEDPLSKFFPDFRHPEVAQRVTLAHMLSHTSGLPDVRNVANDRERFLTAKDEENFAPLKSAERLNFEPGEKFEYSNPAFNGLALVIEKVSKTRWQTFIQREVFRPAQMRHSVITDGSYPSAGVAHAYDKVDGAWKENDYGEFPTFAASGNGGVWCSVEDLLRYELAIQNALFLKRELLALSRTAHSPENWKADAKPAVGFSWFLGDGLVYHSGSQGAFRAWHEVYVEKGLVVVWLGNAGQHSMTVRPILGELLKEHKLL
jgi:CubicO group peptidase (beta-lactamase class C family)